MGIKQTEMVLIIFIFFIVMVIGIVLLFLDKYSNHVRIWRLKKMIWKNKNDYQKIFDLLKKIKLTNQNNILSFRVSYHKTFKNEYRQYTFGNESEEPFVSLRELKKCNSVEELQNLIDEAKATPYIEYVARSLL